MNMVQVCARKNDIVDDFISAAAWFLREDSISVEELENEGYTCMDCGGTDGLALKYMGCHHVDDWPATNGPATKTDCYWLQCSECAYQSRCESAQAAREDDTYGRE